MICRCVPTRFRHLNHLRRPLAQAIDSKMRILEVKRAVFDGKAVAGTVEFPARFEFGYQIMRVQRLGLD